MAFFLFIDLTFSARGTALTRGGKVAHLHFKETVCGFVSLGDAEQTPTQPAVFAMLSHQPEINIPAQLCVCVMRVLLLK